MVAELEILTDAMSNLRVNVEQVIEDLGIQYFNEPMDKGQSGAIELKDGKVYDPRQFLGTSPAAKVYGGT